METQHGDEFKLWDMDEQSEEEALAGILQGAVAGPEALARAGVIMGAMEEAGADQLVSEVLSQTVQRGLGLFSIVDAEAHLNPETFEQLAQNSFKMNDELGHFVDLRVVEDELLQRHREEGPTLGRRAGISVASSRFRLNEERLLRSVSAYGTSFSLGTTFDYNGLWQEESSMPTEPIQQVQGENLPEYTPAQIARAHNQNFRSTGRPPIRVDRNG